MHLLVVCIKALGYYPSLGKFVNAFVKVKANRERLQSSAVVLTGKSSNGGRVNASAEEYTNRHVTH